MTGSLIVDPSEFETLCDEICDAGLVAFDTEFVSESTYRPVLGLLQFATPQRSAAVDPLRVQNLDRWWQLMADDETTVVVHGGQQEIRFCIERLQRPPRKLVDLQLAEGLRSRSYPLGYSAIVLRVLGHRVHGGETRTDWTRRPLSDRQVRYALEDVEHVLPIWKRQRASLKDLGRLTWLDTEMARMIREIEAGLSSESWRKLSGLHKLRPREFAIARELCDWRQRVAEEKNRPLRQILRDDMIVELAHRQPASVRDLTATRDFNRSNYRKVANELFECVQRGLAIPKAQLPRRPEKRRVESDQDEQVIGQLLGIALSNRCAELNIARSLVATTADLRHLVRWHLRGEQVGAVPRLMQGWRSDVCGRLLTDLLDGRISVRVADPESDHPLVFEPVDPSSA